MGRRGRDTGFPRKSPHPSCRDPQKYRSFPWRVRDASHIKHLNLLILYWIDEPLEHLTPKTNREYAQENYRNAGKRKPALKGLVCILTWPENMQKHQIEKDQDHRWRGPTYYSWSIYWKGRNQVRCGQGLRHWQDPLLQSQSTLLMLPLAGIILKFSL